MYVKTLLKHKPEWETCEKCLLHAPDFDAFIQNCFDQEGIMSYDPIFLIVTHFIVFFSYRIRLVEQ